MVRKIKEEQEPLLKLKQAAALNDLSYSIITHDLDGMIPAGDRGTKKMYGYSIEEVLREREGLLTNFYENVNEVIFYLDVEADEKYRFRSANPSFFNTTGLEAIQVIGKFVSEVIPEPSLSFVLLNCNIAVQNRERVCLEETASFLAGNRTASVAINPIIDEQGGCTGLLGIVYDITKIKQAEEMLRASEEKYRKIFDATGTAALIIEEDKTISLVNREFEILSGYSKEEIEGWKSWNEFFTGDNLAKMIGYHILRRVELDSAPQQYESKFITRQGDVKNVIITVSMYPDTKQSIAFLLDISGLKQAEKDVEQSEEKFRTLFEDAPIGIGISRAGQTLMGNRAYLNMFGYANITEFEGMPFLEHIAPQCRSQVKEEIAKARKQQTERSLAFETVGVRKDGSQFPFYIECDSIELPDGPAVLGYFTDITDIKRAQDLRDRYAMLYAYSRDIVLYVRRSDGRIMEANDAAAKAYDYSCVELQGMTIRDLRREDEHQILDEQMRQADERGILFETYHLRKNRSFFPVEVSSQGATINGERILLSIVRDITERKQAELQLMASEERFRSLFEQAPVGIAINRNCRLQLVNQTYADMFGYETSSELIDTLVINHVAPGNRRALMDKVNNLEIGEVQTQRHEIAGRRKDGSIFDAFVQANNIDLPDGPADIAFLTDITEQKQSTAARQRILMQAVTSLGATLDTRDPYTAGHQRRVAQLAVAMAIDMDLSKDQIDGIVVTANLHDIGKMGIPSEILSKPGRLSEIEFAYIKTHSQTGYEIVKDIEFPWPVAEVILQHHERMNGSGYPRGLAREDILVEARIMAVADVVEAMASHRPYRPELGIDKALEEIVQNRGILYDSDVVDACLKLFREKEFKFE